MRATLKIVLALHTLAAFAQAILAGEFLSGLDRPVYFHQTMAWFILGISLCQIAVTAVSMMRAGCPLWILIAGIFSFFAELIQTVTGYARFLNVHVPLGVLIFGLLLVQLAGVFGAGE